MEKLKNNKKIIIIIGVIILIIISIYVLKKIDEYNYEENNYEEYFAEEENILSNNVTHKYVQKPDEIRSYNYTEMNSKLFQFLDKLVTEYSNKRVCT